MNFILLKMLRIKIYADMTRERAAIYKSLLDLKRGDKKKNKKQEQNIRCGIPHPATLIITVGKQTRKFNEPESAEIFLNNLEKRHQ